MVGIISSRVTTEYNIINEWFIIIMFVFGKYNIIDIFVKNEICHINIFIRVIIIPYLLWNIIGHIG